MKTVKQVDEKPISFDDDITADVVEKMPTYRKMFKAAVGLTAKDNGEKAIDLYQLGLKLKNSGDDISLEDSEFSLLKDACNSNPANWISHYHAQVMLKLKDAEK